MVAYGVTWPGWREIWGALLSAFVGAVPVGICSSSGLPEVYLFSLVGHFAVVFGHYITFYSASFVSC